MPLRTIHTALSPNNTWKDTLASLGLLFKPWKWQNGRARASLEGHFMEMMGVDYALAVGSGREALYYILKSLELEKGDEVILQSFTCMVVVNSIVWNGLKPVYTDIDETFNLDVNDLKRKISPKTKVVIVQHTFGIPAEIEKIKKLCSDNQIILIEDCAHALGASVDGKLVGSFGDLAFFSLGRSKVISCINGGVLISNNRKYLAGLKKHQVDLQTWSKKYIVQNLLHPIVSSKAKALYFSPIGKLIMVVSQKLKLINLEVTPDEKRGHKPKYFVSNLANAMAEIALIQFSYLDKFNRQRRKCAEYYFRHLKVGTKIDPLDRTGAIFLRYPLLIKNPAKVQAEAKKQGIILGDWYSSPIAPGDIDKSKTFYLEGDCPKCENINQRIINLPTNQGLTEKDLEKIVSIVNKYAEN